MSYVLDALRRAEADRQRGQVPDLHAPMDAPGAAAAPVGAVRRPVLLWLSALLALVVCAAVAWWWAAGSAAPVVASNHGDPAVRQPEAESGLNVTQPAAAPAALPVARPQPQAPEAGGPALVPPPIARAPAPPPVALPETSPLRRVAPPETPTTQARSSAGAPPVPPMAFGGAFDSPDPKARMLIINGQVWREGDEPLPGWVLERIGLHAARFRTQGQAVDVSYAAGAGR